MAQSRMKVEDFPVKFERPRELHAAGLTIWEVPDNGLYRVYEPNAGDYHVETLTVSGWTQLITLSAKEAKSPAEALQVWIDIQAPSASREEGHDSA